MSNFAPYCTKVAPISADGRHAVVILTTLPVIITLTIQRWIVEGTTSGLLN